MPVYEYKSDTGEVIELERPITERNDAPDGYTRMIYPSRISVPNGASDEKGMNKESVRRGYYDQEQKMAQQAFSKSNQKSLGDLNYELSK